MKKTIERFGPAAMALAVFSLISACGGGDEDNAGVASTMGAVMGPNGCVRPTTCGNGIIDAGETCDPGDGKPAGMCAMCAAWPTGKTCETEVGTGSSGSLFCNECCQLDNSMCSAATQMLNMGSGAPPQTAPTPMGAGGAGG